MKITPGRAAQNAQRPLPESPRGQGGVALVVSMLLLILVTLVGLSAIRGTTQQQTLAGNLYDREIALQSAEAAVNVAIATYDADPNAANLVWHDCQTGGVNCRGNPFSDTNLPTANIHTVASGTTATTYTASAIAVGQPQFVIERMGAYGSGSGNAQQTTSAENEGSNQVQSGSASTFIRITARSASPATAGADSRAIVTLQTVIRR